MRTNVRRFVGLLALLFVWMTCCACASGPTPADVAADRDRWTAVRDVTADDTIDAAEKPLLGELLTAWDEKLTAEEAAASRPRDWKAYAIELGRVYGMVALEVAMSETMPDIRAKAKARFPEAWRLVDANADDSISLDELFAVDPASPVFAIVVATTAARLLRGSP